MGNCSTSVGLHRHYFAGIFFPLAAAQLVVGAVGKRGSAYCQCLFCHWLCFPVPHRLDAVVLSIFSSFSYCNYSELIIFLLVEVEEFSIFLS